jgi:hypothetical protein
VRREGPTPDVVGDVRLLDAVTDNPAYDHEIGFQLVAGFAILIVSLTI